MTRWKDAPIVGGAYSDDARAWSVQDTVNFIPVTAEREGTRSQKMLRCAPGFVEYVDLGTNAPVRGLRNVEGLLIAVSGNSAFSLTGTGGPKNLGNIPGVGRTKMSHNQIAGGNQVAIPNGQSGYVYNTVTDTLVQITDDAFPGAKTFEYLDSFILGIEPGGRFVFNSDLADALSYSTIDRNEAEGSPDLLVGQLVTHLEWWLFGQRTIEIYQNTGAATGTFARATGTVLDVGAASPHAICSLDNGPFWLGNDGIVYRANGYTPVRISTYAIEQAISRCDLAKAFMFTFEDRGHKIVYLTLQDGKTWGYDVATQEWHRRQSYGLDRWRINDLVFWNGMWIAGDYANGKLYRLDWDTQTEDGVVMERRRITGVLHDSQNRVTVNAIQLVIDTGLPSPSTYISISGDLPDGQNGKVVHYAYTTSGGTSPLTFTLSGGALPAGLSMSSQGVITGVMAGGSVEGTVFSWTVKVTDATGQTSSLTDSCLVTLPVEGKWMLMNSGDATGIWLSDHPATWPDAYTRTTAMEPSGATGGYDGFALAIPGSGTNAIAIRNQTFGGGSITSETVDTTDTGERIYAVSGVMFKTVKGTGSTDYHYSTDHGTTWLSHVSPNGGYLEGIARFTSGRWVALFINGPIQQVMYADGAIPNAWAIASGSFTGTLCHDIACDGDTAIIVNNSSIVFRSVNGSAWSPEGAYPSAIGSPNTFLLLAKGGGVFLGQTNAVSGICVSLDSGITWTQHNISGEGDRQLLSMATDGSVFALCFSTNPGNPPVVYVSDDNGDTLTLSALPYVSNASPVIAFFGNGL